MIQPPKLNAGQMLWIGVGLVVVVKVISIVGLLTSDSAGWPVLSLKSLVATTLGVLHSLGIGLIVGSVAVRALTNDHVVKPGRAP